MAFGHIDVELTVAGDGTAVSIVKFADYLHNFATKCDPATTYKYEFTDQDGYGIYGEPDVQLTGPYASPINRRVKNFKIKVYSATVGAVITFRVGAD